MALGHGCGTFLAALAVGGLALAAELTVESLESGLIQGVSVDGQRVVGEINLLIPQAQWQGEHGTLRDATVTERSTDPATATQATRGTMPAGGVVLFDYVCTLRRLASGVRVDYEVTPRQAVEAAGVVTQLYLDLDLMKGREWAMVEGDTVRVGTFPAVLTEPYSFFSESGFERLTWPLTAATSLALVPDWQTVGHVNIQDDRRFNTPAYEIQIFARTPGRLEPGTPVRLGFTLMAVSSTETSAVQAAAKARLEALRGTLKGEDEAAITGTTPQTASVSAYARFELAVDLKARYENPFDPAQVALDGHFITPAGKEEVVPGFYGWDFERALRADSERVTPTGQGGWAVRYCPRQPGVYRYWVTLQNQGRTVRSAEATFTCVASANPGLVRVSRTNPLYFEFDNGEPYFAIGENVCWPGQGGTYDYDRYWKRLAENGANYARVWVGPFDCFTLERTARGADDTAGLGRIDLAAAWRLDTMLDLAERSGIRVMFCIDSFNSLRRSPPHAMWAQCPYNAAHGGPLAEPQEFFTNPAAKALFKNRLRYIVARWGHQPAVLSWEFWNEVNIIETYVSADVAAWHQEMARTLRSLDPYAHLITTSWASAEGDAATDGLPEMDYIQSHQYGARDPAAYMARICIEKANRYRKPHYFGEYGTGTEAQGTTDDKPGIHLHNGLWSGLMSNAAGTGMLWWWDNYVDPLDLYHHFRPIAEFVRGLPLNTTDFRPVSVAGIAYAGPPPAPRREDLELLPDAASWDAAPCNQPNTFVVHADGQVENRAALSRVLHGTGNHPTLHNPATFAVDYGQPGEFIVRVSGVSGHGGAGLKVFVDDRLALAKDFPDEDKDTATMLQFNGAYRVEVPAGKHRIRVVNEGRDWVYVDYGLPGYRQREDSGLQVYGLANGSTTAGQVAAILWFKNERYTWYYHNQGLAPGEIAATRVTLQAIPDGRYVVEWWDTATGKPGATATLEARGQQLVVDVPALSTDVAAKVRRAAP
jgi:hypothetical protein